MNLPVGKIHETIPAAARITLASAKIAFAVAVLENAHEEPAQIVAIPAADLLEREVALQEQAKANLARRAIRCECVRRLTVTLPPRVTLQ